MGIYLPEKVIFTEAAMFVRPYWSTGMSVYNGIKHTCLSLYIGIGIKHIISLLV